MALENALFNDSTILWQHYLITKLITVSLLSVMWMQIYILSLEDELTSQLYSAFRIKSGDSATILLVEIPVVSMMIVKLRPYKLCNISYQGLCFDKYVLFWECTFFIFITFEIYW